MFRSNNWNRQTVKIEDPAVWKALHDRCFAVKTLTIGIEAPQGIAQEVWNTTLLNAYLCLNTPIPGIDDNES